MRWMGMASCTDFGIVNFSFSNFVAVTSVLIIGILHFSAKNEKVTVVSQLVAETSAFSFCVAAFRLLRWHLSMLRVRDSQT